MARETSCKRTKLGEYGSLARVRLAGLSLARSAIASVLMRGWLNVFPSSALLSLRRV